MVNRDRLKGQAAAAIAIITLVLVTNEAYRFVRNVLDNMAQIKQEVAQLKRDQYVLQVQIDNQPGISRPASDAARSSVPLPLPFPMSPKGFESTIADAPPATTPSKKQPSTEAKSLLNVSLISDSDSSKAGTGHVGSNANTAEGPKMNVQLLGDQK